MTVPTIRTPSTGFNVANTTTTTVTLPPASFVDGDTVYIAIVSDLTSQVFTGPSGFTSLFGDVPTYNSGGSSATCAVFYKRNIVKANETFDGTNYTFAVGMGTTERQSWVCFAVANDGGSFDVTGTAHTNNSGTAVVNFIVTTQPDCLYIAVYAMDNSTGAVTPTSSPGMTLVAEAEGTTAAAISVYYENANVAGSYPTVSSAITLQRSEQSVGLGFAIAPLGAGPNVTNSATLAETVTITLSAPSASVSNAVAASESPNIALCSLITKSDAATLSESVTLGIATVLSPSESVTVTEAVAFLITRNLSVADTVTGSEDWPVILASLVAVADSLTAAEALAFAQSFSLVTSDSLVISEQANASIPGTSATQVVVSDALALTDAVSIVIGTGAINRSEAILLTESRTVTVISLISKAEAASLSESVTLNLADLFGVTDAMTIADAPNVAQALTLAVADAMTHAESVAAARAFVTSQAEAVALTETVLIKIALPFAVIDSATLADAASVSITRTVKISESISHSESVKLTLAFGLAVSDSLTHTEAAGATLSQPDRYETASDGLSTAEFVRLYICVSRMRVSRFI